MYDPANRMLAMEPVGTDMRYAIFLLTFCLTTPVHAIRGCFDLQGYTLNAGEPNNLGVSAQYHCGRGSDLCTLVVRVPPEFEEVAVSYDMSKKPDSDLYLHLQVHDWDEAAINSEYRADSDVAMFMKPKFHGVIFNLSKRVSKGLKLSMYNSEACENIEVKDLDGWMVDN